MYEMYPDDWAPAKNRTYRHHDDRARAAVQAALDLRDGGGEAPEDN